MKKPFAKISSMDITDLYSTVTISEKYRKILGPRRKIYHKNIGKNPALVQACPMVCLHEILDMIHFDFTSLVDEIMQIA